MSIDTQQDLEDHRMAHLQWMQERCSHPNFNDRGCCTLCGLCEEEQVVVADDITNDPDARD